MILHFYDTYSRSLREFQPQHTGLVGLYACGPTVYNFAHIGNLRTYIFVDLLRRTLEFSGYRVNHVMNITDVGHLTSDADSGDDKMILGARRAGKSAWAIAADYTAAFEIDLQLLNILPPSVWCRATDYIAEQIEFILELEHKGFTYKTADGVYFNTALQPDYGYLARLEKHGLHAGQRVEMGEKKHPCDFALWKFSAGSAKRQMEWDSPWGIGFPGWHIECSAMSAAHLGEYFDIHCGGEDHVAVHHSNEIAQTEARYGTRLANFWLHGAFLKTNDAKMSKSDGTFLRLQTLLDQGVDPLAYRYLCLSAHYRSQLNFSDQALSSAVVGLERLRMTVYKLGVAGQANDDYVQRFFNELAHDLNLPRALAVVWEMLKGNLSDSSKKATVIRLDAVLGLGLAAWVPDVIALPEAVTELVQQRKSARTEKRWSDADALRAQIRDAGYEIDDSPFEQQLRKILSH